jgi:hypothetical protein
MFWSLAGFFYHVHDNYESYLMGREKERNTITLSYPPVGMVDMDNKNYCVDGHLNVHEVKYVGGKFISKKVHLTKNGEAPQ